MSDCPLCGQAADAWMLQQSESIVLPVAEALAQRSPGWQVSRGACPQCVLEAMREHIRSRSAFSLHTRTQPNTTFPYYHPEDESVLGLSERLPDYFTFPAAGVGIGFLDSGFFPHPDLCAISASEPIEWERLSRAQLRAKILALQPRLIEYVDLTADGEETGLEVESLWAGDFLSWHGQMTSTIAAGNGVLSNSRYRGYAAQAKILPIRVGRGDGRIPEADILRGFEWLLKAKRWQRHGVRVLNVSVGGDFPQDWRFNAISRAAMQLHEEGVLVVAAAGNRPVEELLPPAQTPSVLAVGGIDDHNLRWSPIEQGWSVLGGRQPVDISLSMYSHNYGTVQTYVSGNSAKRADRPQKPVLHVKPDLLAPSNYLPSPILPVHTAFRETHAIDRLRTTLRGNDPRADELVAHWQRILRHDPNPALAETHSLRLDEDDDEIATAEWMGDVWQPLRKRMNAQKWTHAAYQHVDGTSVASAVVSAVAAQIAQANSSLTSDKVKSILCETAAPVDGFPAERRGAGVLQPAAAVAAALRAPGGILAGIPRSGTVLSENELRKWRDLATIAIAAPLLPPVRSFPDGALRPVYVGILAPDADEVAWVSEVNGWNPATHSLKSERNGWWHLVLVLPPGEYLYRFYLRRDASVTWCADPESGVRVEGGYLPPGGDHSVLLVQ